MMAACLIAEVMAGGEYNASLLGGGHCFCATAVAFVVTVANFDKNQVIGAARDNVDFSKAAAIIPCYDI
jgi:hydroxylamine reductase (hybrid-cluster protein)